MLKKRIIPVLLFKDNSLVKGKNFNSWRTIGSVLPTIKIFGIRQVDELIFLNINATDENAIDYNIINDISRYCSFPFAVGGGIKTVTDIKRILRNGADKVCINTAAYSDHKFINDAVNLFGSQCITISIDVVKENDKYVCYSNSGKVRTKYDLEEWLTTVNTFNVGEILITSIDREGTMQGYDMDLIKIVNSKTNTPILVNGGCSSYDDMLTVFKETDTSAVCASSIYQFTSQTPKEAKAFLRKKDINVRPIFI
jgi:cyclase